MFEGPKVTSCARALFTTRARYGPRRPVGAGGGAVDLIIELMSCYFISPPVGPASGVWLSNGRWSMWTQAQAVKALRQVVSVAGVQTEECALHSLGIGGVTQPQHTCRLGAPIVRY